jgi:metal-responsive CopG/Arc/MetJ family transcriptional regulator
MTSVKVAISLPAETLRTVDREAAARGVARSELFRRAVEELLRQEAEATADQKYIEAYTEQPEDEAEVSVFHSLGLAAVATERWDEAG